MTAQPLGLLGPVYLMSIAATREQARAAADLFRDKEAGDALYAEWLETFAPQQIESTAVTS